MLRDVVTEQEPKGIPVIVDAVVAKPEPKEPRKTRSLPRTTPRRADDRFIPSKRLKSMYRRANVHIPLREWAAMLRGEDKSVVDQWLKNKHG